jgi:hypothetical protein
MSKAMAQLLPDSVLLMCAFAAFAAAATLKVDVVCCDLT